MAPRRKDDLKTSNGTGKGRIKFRYSDGDRYLDLDMDGIANDAVADGLKSIANALAGRNVIASTRTLPRPAPAPPTAPEDEEHEPEATEPEVEEREPEAIESENGAIEATDDDKPKQRRSAPKAPTFLSDIDLTKATVQLTDFVKGKNPSGDMDKYAVIAAWFKEQLKIEEVTIDHIFTAYNALGWKAQLPDDPAQTFRNLKSNKNWFDSGSKRGTYKINWNGMNAVNKMGAADSE